MQEVQTSITQTSAQISQSVAILQGKLSILQATAYPDKLARTAASAGLAIGLFGVAVAGANMWLLFMCLLARRRVHSGSFDSEEDPDLKKVVKPKRRSGR